MSNAIYLKLGDAKGECQKENHKEQIELNSIGWGISNASANTSKGPAAGVSMAGDLTVSKDIDSSTPAIIMHCGSGKVFPEAIVYVDRAAGDGEVVQALTITLTNVFVSSYNISDASGMGLPSETITLNFEEIKLEYEVQEGTGAAGTKIPVTYSVVTGKAE